MGGALSAALVLAATANAAPSRVTHLSEVDVSPRLHGHALAVGGVLTVEALKSGYTGIVFRFAVRARREPAFSKGCLVNGPNRPVPC
ncbi:MAG TPA: hypothetical protein VMU39_15700 [Solirubrobacteraceae bacterium]|nr:hypothetical protein [Solirubrobacteraceae bacterium]